MSENQEDVPKPDAPNPDVPKPDVPKPDVPKPDVPKPDVPKPDVPPPSMSKGPAAPPPPSMTGGAASPPPPSLSAPPPPPPVQEAGAGPIKVKVKPDSADDEEDVGSREPLVSLANRVGAAMIDAGIALGLYIAALMVLPGFAEKLAGILAMAYIVTRDGLPFLHGQSVGKMAMKIRAVTRDGKSLSGNWQPALIRNAVLLIPVFPFIELIVLLTREDKHDQGVRLGDEWAKTKVVPVMPSEETEGDQEKDDGGDNDEAA